MASIKPCHPLMWSLPQPRPISRRRVFVGAATSTRHTAGKPRELPSLASTIRTISLLSILWSQQSTTGPKALTHVTLSSTRDLAQWGTRDPVTAVKAAQNGAKEQSGGIEEHSVCVEQTKPPSLGSPAAKTHNTDRTALSYDHYMAESWSSTPVESSMTNTYVKELAINKTPRRVTPRDKSTNRLLKSSAHRPTHRTCQALPHDHDAVRKAPDAPKTPAFPSMPHARPLHSSCVVRDQMPA